MKLKNRNAEIFIPDGDTIKNALEKTTHMSIAAHQDDIELMSLDGILKCFGVNDQWFTGVVLTNGGGSPRKGIYAAFTDVQMQEIRKKEQKKAAVIGEYGAQVLLGYSSSDVKKSDNPELVEELAELMGAAVGATRDAVELGWATYPHQVGLSGKTVSPKLIIALGIAGKIQFLAGMQTSDVIVAVNKDPEALIFKVADFGIVGDVFEVVPMLIETVKKMKAKA